MTKEEAVQLLRQGLESLLNEESFRRFLAFRAKFHQYSLPNTILILIQKPDATQVAGYKTWQALGRQVRKGAQGIAILAPLIRKVKGNIEDDPNAEGNTEDPVAARLVGFRIVHVFDVSQTEGDAVPEPPPPKRLDGDDHGLLAGLQDFAGRRGIRILNEAPKTPGANGEYSRAENLIRLRPDLPPLQKAKTLAHELGHAILHRSDELPREVREVEAESVAYVVLACSGFDAGEFSLPYLARYTSDTKTLTQQVGRIVHAADAILDALSADQNRAQAA